MLGDEQQISPAQSKFCPYPGGGDCAGKILQPSLPHSAGTKVVLAKEGCHERERCDDGKKYNGRVGPGDGEIQRKLLVDNELSLVHDMGAKILLSKAGWIKKGNVMKGRAMIEDREGTIEGQHFGDSEMEREL